MTVNHIDCTNENRMEWLAKLTDGCCICYKDFAFVVNTISEIELLICFFEDKKLKKERKEIELVPN